MTMKTMFGLLHRSALRREICPEEKECQKDRCDAGKMEFVKGYAT